MKSIHLFSLNSPATVRKGLCIIIMSLLSSVASASASCASGSYQFTCTNASCSGTTLSAKCKTEASTYTQSSLDVSSCSSTSVENNNGRLECS
jgi:hypothetical protein